MRWPFVFITTFSMFIRLTSFAQLQTDRDKIMKERLDKINFYHFGAGIEVAGNKNFTLGSKCYVGVGSSRNLYNVDLGFKFLCSNLIRFSTEEYISSCYMPMFLSGSLNFFRRKLRSVYVGGELSYCIALGSNHHINDQYTEKDKCSIARSHLSWQGKLGFRHKYWNFYLFYENDLSPAMDQRFVYESVEYDYAKVYDSIFERSRVGVSATYNFSF